MGTFVALFYLGRQYPHSWECERQNQLDKSIYVFNFEKGKFIRGILKFEGEKQQSTLKQNKNYIKYLLQACW